MNVLSLLEGFVAGAVVSGVAVTLVWRNNQKSLAAANAALTTVLAAVKKL